MSTIAERGAVLRQHFAKLSAAGQPFCVSSECEKRLESFLSRARVAMEAAFSQKAKQPQQPQPKKRWRGDQNAAYQSAYQNNAYQNAHQQGYPRTSYGPTQAGGVQAGSNYFQNGAFGAAPYPAASFVNSPSSFFAANAGGQQGAWPQGGGHQKGGNKNGNKAGKSSS